MLDKCQGSQGCPWCWLRLGKSSARLDDLPIDKTLQASELIIVRLCSDLREWDAGVEPLIRPFRSCRTIDGVVPVHPFVGCSCIK